MDSTAQQPSSEELDEEQDNIVDDIKPIVLPSKRLKCIENDNHNKLINCDINNDIRKDQRRAPSPDIESLKKYPKIMSNSSIVSHSSSPNFQRENSIRSLKNYHHIFNNDGMNGKPSSSDSGSQMGSMRSWASVGMGSTDGKKMIVRRVPTSPVELFNIVNPPT